MPYLCIAVIEYSEHVGVNLQVAPKNGDMKSLYVFMRYMVIQSKNNLILCIVYYSILFLLVYR